MLKWIYPGSRGWDADIVLLLMRLALGVAMVLYGAPKIMAPLSWLPVFPWPLLLLAAVAEFFGGLALIVGALTRLASFGIACTMATAGFYWHLAVRGDPYVRLPRGGGDAFWDLPTWLVMQGGQGGSYALATAYLVIAIAVLVLGPGRLSLDALVARRKTGGRAGW